MANGFVKKDTFLGAEQETRDALLYDMLSTTHDAIVSDKAEIKGCIKKVDDRTRKLENRKIKDTAIATTTSAIAGAIGGFVAVITKPFMGGP